MLEKAPMAAQKFSIPKIKNKGRKQLSTNANLVNLLIFHQSVQLFGYQIQINTTAQYTYYGPK